MCNVHKQYKKVQYSFLLTSKIHNCHSYSTLYTMQKFRFFPACQILREINIGGFTFKTSNNIYLVVFTKNLSGKHIPKFPHCAILHIFSLSTSYVYIIQKINISIFVLLLTYTFLLSCIKNSLFLSIVSLLRKCFRLM